MSALPKENPAPSLRENEKKWTKTLMDAGWTALPSVFLERQKAFGLDAIDFNIVMHLASHWWYASEDPFPGKKSIAEAMGISPRTVQRRIAQMEAAGFLKRTVRSHHKYGRQSNSYSLGGLIKEAKPYAEEIIEAKQKNRDERQKRRHSKTARPSHMKLAE
jgi:DNA-binding HxlR family transcriptional regulator